MHEKIPYRSMGMSMLCIMLCLPVHSLVLLTVAVVIHLGGLLTCLAPADGIPIIKALLL